MNPIERQILMNQFVIMAHTRAEIKVDGLNFKPLDDEYRNTGRLLFDEKEKEPCCDMSEKDALEERGEEDGN